MQLAVKYKVEALRKMIIERIVADWPCNFKEWEHREREMQQDAIAASKLDNAYYLYKTLPEPASAIRFAMDFKAYDLLPAAFYALSRNVNIRGWGTVQGRDTTPARWDLLEAADLLRLLAGRMSLSELFRVHFEYMKEKVIGECKGDAEPSCVTLLQQITEPNWPSRWNRRQPIDPLGFCVHLVDTDIKWCCEAGRLAFHTAVADLAEKLWEGLPCYFDFENLLYACN